MRRRALATVVASLGLVACATATTSPHGSPAVTVVVAPPPGSGIVADAGIDVVAADAVHPEVLRAALAEAGFVGGSERVATAGADFSRVVVRRLRFGDEAGAQAFVEWISANAATEFFAVEPLPSDAGVVLLRHVPDGCCPRELRIYVAAWTQGDEVITVKAQGPRSTDDAMANLVDDIRTGEGS